MSYTLEPVLNERAALGASAWPGKRQEVQAGHLRAGMLVGAAEALDRHPITVILVLSLVYLAGVFAVAHVKQLWDDEFFTYYIAEAGYRGTWHALLTGADQHPPTFYWLVHSVTKVLGFSHIRFRLCSIVAFWSMSLLLYRYVSRRSSNLLGYAAMLFPATSHLFYYAVEARGYALLMMFAALAFVAWQSAAAGVRRRVTVPLFGIALAAGFCSHYYMVLAFIPFALGELARAMERRRPDGPLWIAGCLPLAPMFLFAPVLHAAQGYSQAFWAKPSMQVLADCYHLAFGGGAMALLMCLVLGYIWATRSQPNAPRAPFREASLPFHEKLVVVSFALLPIFGFIMAKTVTHGLWPRYTSPCIIGVTILLVISGHKLSGGSKLFAATMAFFLLICGVIRFNMTLEEERGHAMELDFAYKSMMGAAEPGEPIAIGKVTIFHKLWFYGPAELRPRMTYLCDPARSIKYIGHDTIDRGLLDLKPWFKEDVRRFDDYVAATPHFLSFGCVNDWDWLSFGLVDSHLFSQLYGRTGQFVSFQVWNLHVPSRLDSAPASRPPADSESAAPPSRGDEPFVWRYVEHPDRLQSGDGAR